MITAYLQGMVNNLVSESMDLKRRISLTEQKISNIEKPIEDLKQQVSEA